MRKATTFSTMMLVISIAAMVMFGFAFAAKGGQGKGKGQGGGGGGDTIQDTGPGNGGGTTTVSVSVPDGDFGTVVVGSVSPSADSQYVLAQCNQGDSLVLSYLISWDADNTFDVILGPTYVWSSGGASCTAAVGFFDKQGDWVSEASTTFTTY